LDRLNEQPEIHDYVEPEKIEIADLRFELLKLARSGILPKRTADSCTQAAALLVKFRELLIPELTPDAYVLKKLRMALGAQGEG